MSPAQDNQKKPAPRSTARLGAVQALYQLLQDDDVTVEEVIIQFKDHRLGQEVEGDLYAPADDEFFADLVRGAEGDLDALKVLINGSLSNSWTVERLEKILLAILLAGSYELKTRVDVPTAVVINEYLDVTHAFYDQKQAKFVNGVLDKISKSVRH